MVQIACHNKVINFDSVEKIRKGLNHRGARQLAAIEAAGRYPYPSDHDDERTDIRDEIFLIGAAATSREVWGACVASLYCLDVELSTRLQANPPERRVSPVLEAPTAAQQHAARQTYPYSEIGD